MYILFVLAIGALITPSLSLLRMPVLSAMSRSRTRGELWLASPDLCVMVNGMPGPMALETAKACVDRGYKLIPWGFTGPNMISDIDVTGSSKTVKVHLVKGPGVGGPEVIDLLRKIKNENPNLVVIDYTHPSATLNNVKAYVSCECDFVMGTTGGDLVQMTEIQSKAKNSIAVIAPNMAKQIVAVQATLQHMASRFPNSFVDYKLSVRESHQSTKADTSGTAKAIVSHLATLNGEKSFTLEDIEMIRDEKGQLAFGVPSEALRGHAFHTYRLVSSDGSVAFELQHNVCGRRVYAEGTADAVAFVDEIRRRGGRTKSLFNMIDVLEAGAMN